LVKHFSRRPSIVSRNTGRFYALNTLGAVVGGLAASFWLIGTLGVHATVAFAAAFNILAGSIVLAASSLAGDVGTGERPESAAPAAARPSSEPLRLMRALPLIYAVSGFVALSLEVVWVRMLGMLTSMQVQSFSVMLAILLCGIAIGSAVFTRWLAGRINAVAWLVGLEIAIGLWTLLSVPLFRRIPPVPLPPHGPTPLYDAPAPPVALTVVGPSLVLTLVPAVLMGIIFPMIVGFYAGHIGKVGENFGRVYGANTLGGILGSFAGGFVLLPLLGIERSMVLLGALSIGIACALVVLSQGLRLRPRFGPLAASAAVMALLVAAAGAASGIRPPVRGLGYPWRLIHYREGLTAAIRVFENEETGVRELFSDSWFIASTEHMTMRLQRMLANLPLLLHQHPEQVLIVGFGTGTTSGTSMLYDVDVDAIELEPTERQSAGLFRHVNYGILDERWRSKFTLRIDDGRNWLLSRRKSYDVISRDAHLAKPSQDLFSQEFLELAQRRLKPGGIFCGFLPLESTYMVKRMLAAFHKVFPHGSLWQISPISMLVLGTHERLDIDYQVLSARMAMPAIQQDLNSINFGEPGDLLSSFVMADDDLGRFVSGYDAASDERPLGFLNAPDFGSPRDIQSLGDDLIRHRASIDPYLHNIGVSEQEESKVRDALGSQSAAMSHLIRGQLSLLVFRDPKAAARELEQALQGRENWREARFQYSMALAAEAERLLEGTNTSEAIDLAAKAVNYAEDYAPHYVLLGRAYEKLGQPSTALRYFEKASTLLDAQGFPAIPLVKEKLAQTRQ
jgi:spermidine synthase